MKRAIGFLNNTFTLLMVALLYHQTCLAQVDPWERVKLIEQGKNVSVKLHSGKTVSGKIESWSTDGLSVRQGKDKVTPLAKSDVAQVALVTGMSRGRKAAYGFMIGGAAGAGIGGAAAAGNGGGCCDVPPGALVGGMALLVGGIAAGIAAAFPQHKEVIYTTESAQLASAK